ncbi:MAG: hypothetical protein SVG88_05795 [Halobacteriales archaeon]|nr:hypothetical protein [Halobacteriales archaeon]
MSEDSTESDEDRGRTSGIERVEDIGPHMADENETNSDTSDTGGSNDSDSRERDEPLAGLAEEVEERRKHHDDTDLDFEGFDEEEFTEIDSDRLWTELERGSDEPVAVGDPIEEEPDATGDVRVIPDRTCHRCRFFSDPPAVHCNHEGTKILEIVDDDHFKVVDCPMVIDDTPDDSGGFQFQFADSDDAE